MSTEHQFYVVCGIFFFEIIHIIPRSSTTKAKMNQADPLTWVSWRFCDIDLLTFYASSSAEFSQHQFVVVTTGAFTFTSVVIFLCRCFLFCFGCLFVFVLFFKSSPLNTENRLSKQFKKLSLNKGLMLKPFAQRAKLKLNPASKTMA